MKTESMYTFVHKQKIRQTNVPKITQGEQARRTGERIFIDTSSMMHPSVGGRKHWLLIVDEATDYAHCIFSKQKSDEVKILK